jgi:DNA-binding IclR family transcriptional regulator
MQNRTKDDFPTDDRHFVTALARGLEVLRCFNARDRALTNGELSARTGFPKSTVSRLTRTLTRLDYLKHDGEAGAYRIGAAVLALGYASLANMRIRDLARPLMQDLADYSNGIVSLATRERLAMMYLDYCRPRSTVTLSVHSGLQVAMATTSIGRAFLAALPDAERLYLMNQLKARDPARWPPLALGVERAVAEYRTHGFCTSLGEWKKDVNAVAVPLLSPALDDVVVFSCSGPRHSISERQLTDDLGPRLGYLVRHLETTLTATVTSDASAVDETDRE